MNLQNTIAALEPVSDVWRKKAEEYILTLTMPPWALGRILDTAVDLCGIQRTLKPETAKKQIVLFAGDHGVVAQGVAATPQSVTVEMVHNFLRHGAAVNVLADTVKADVAVVDMGVNADLSKEAAAGLLIDEKIGFGTKDISMRPAMTREEAVRSLEAGIRMAEKFSSADILATGEMGIGNTTPSSAIVALLSGCAADPLACVDRGAGIPEERVVHKAEIVRKALAVNKPDPEDGVDILAKVGGFEIGGIAGLILGGAMLKKPVFVDGFISTAGALIAMKIAPVSAQYMIFAHGSAERGHVSMMKLLGKKPLLDLGMRLGEGSGAAAAMFLADCAANLMKKMATFESAGVNV